MSTSDDINPEVAGEQNGPPLTTTGRIESSEFIQNNY